MQDLIAIDKETFRVLLSDTMVALANESDAYHQCRTIAARMLAGNKGDIDDVTRRVAFFTSTIYRLKQESRLDRYRKDSKTNRIGGTYDYRFINNNKGDQL